MGLVQIPPKCQKMAKPGNFNYTPPNSPQSTTPISLKLGELGIVLEFAQGAHHHQVNQGDKKVAFWAAKTKKDQNLP